MAYCHQVGGVVTFPLWCLKKRQHIKIASRQAATTSPGQASGRAKHKSHRLLAPCQCRLTLRNRGRFAVDSANHW